MVVKVKICGITNVADALAAVESGADALGFMFYAKSSRAISPGTATAIIRALPPFVARVGVFVDPTEDQVISAVESCGLDTVQFHGNEPPDFCEFFSDLKVIKAFRIQGPESIPGLTVYPTAAWLLDSFVAGQMGGTGTGFNWELALDAKKLGRPVILAGGLTPETVEEAVSQVQPFGVDVSSGVELAPGKKDAGKMRDFISRAKRANLLAAE